MQNSRRQKKETSTYGILFARICQKSDHPIISSRYFSAQNGKEYKWRIAAQRLEVGHACAQMDLRLS